MGGQAARRHLQLLLLVVLLVGMVVVVVVMVGVGVGVCQAARIAEVGNREARAVHGLQQVVLWVRACVEATRRTVLQHAAAVPLQVCGGCARCGELLWVCVGAAVGCTWDCCYECGVGGEGCGSRGKLIWDTTARGLAWSGLTEGIALQKIVRE